MSYKGKIDKRTEDRYVEKGLLKQSDVDAHMKNLPDDSANAEWVKLDLEDSDLGDADESEGLEENVEE